MDILDDELDQAFKFSGLVLSVDDDVFVGLELVPDTYSVGELDFDKFEIDVKVSDQSCESMPTFHRQAFFLDDIIAHIKWIQNLQRINSLEIPVQREIRTEINKGTEKVVNSRLVVFIAALLEFLKRIPGVVGPNLGLLAVFF